MAKTAKNAGAERKYLAEQDEKVAMQIKEVLCFFHSEVLHGFIALTMLKSLLLIIFLILGYSVPRAARLLGFCPATVRSKKALFKSGQMKQIFSGLRRVSWVKKRPIHSVSPRSMRHARSSGPPLFFACILLPCDGFLQSVRR